jgi:hypothetical protein
LQIQLDLLSDLTNRLRFWLAWKHFVISSSDKVSSIILSIKLQIKLYKNPSYNSSKVLSPNLHLTYFGVVYRPLSFKTTTNNLIIEIDNKIHDCII